MTCKTCGETKPLHQFAKDRGRYRLHCAPCRNLRRLQWAKSLGTPSVPSYLVTGKYGIPQEFLSWISPRVHSPSI